MSRLKSELELTCPCCGSTLVFDRNLERIVEHKEPERADKPELSDAQRILVPVSSAIGDRPTLTAVLNWTADIKK